TEKVEEIIENSVYMSPADGQAQPFGNLPIENYAYFIKSTLASCKIVGIFVKKPQT
ncbi:unnamed protein product, partial [marine sediment metagenome]